MQHELHVQNNEYNNFILIGVMVIISLQYMITRTSLLFLIVILILMFVTVIFLAYPMMRLNMLHKHVIISQY